MIMVETSRAFGRRVIEGIAQYARENGPWSIHFEDWGLDSIPPDIFKEGQFDGIISRTINMKVAKLRKTAKTPCIELMGTSLTDKAEVMMDIALAAEMAVEHFLNHGYRHFAFCTTEYNWWTSEHEDSFRRAVESKKYRLFSYAAPKLQQPIVHWHEKYRKPISKWLRSLPRPVGIYASSDLIAVRLLEICRQLDISVPEEAAILGIGNDPLLCETVRPTLSSLDLDARRIGYEAAKLLERKMAKKALPPKAILVPPSHIVARQSTDYTAVEDADILQAMQWIQASACSGLDVGRLAGKIGMSQKVLERRFRHYFGSTPKKEIVQVRIEKAKMLLAQTEETLVSIARKCGFNSRVYFMRAFRREVGTTPYTYRQEQRLSRNKNEK
jgi:LacI family transcriptional regulator